MPDASTGAAPELDFLDEEEQNPDEGQEPLPPGEEPYSATSDVAEEQREAQLDEDACDRFYRKWVDGYLGDKGPITKHPLRDAFDAAWRASRGR